MEVLLNCAVDAKGHMAGAGGEPVRLSDEQDLRRVHQMRARADAMVVGVGTVLRDDPRLRVKAAYAEGPDPVRVVLDSHLRTPTTARVLDGSAPTRIYTTEGGSLPGATCVRVPAGSGGVDLAAVLADLEAAGLRRIMVEGGPTVLRSFIEAGLWQAWTVYQAPLTLADGPGLWGGLPARQPAGVRLRSRLGAGKGTLWTFSPG